MEYKVLRKFKCRKQNFKIYDVEGSYKSVDDEHTKMLIDLGFIEEIKKPKTKKKADKS